MKILVIDAQGGGIGKQIVQAIRNEVADAYVMAVGTNTQATGAMLKAGADEAATGENAVVVACKKADVIVGPIGIALADSMLGEVTPKMALAVAQADAKRIFLPFKHCDTVIAGISDYSIPTLIRAAIAEMKKQNLQLLSNQS